MDPVVRIMFQQVRERLPFYRLVSSILIYSPFAARVFFYRCCCVERQNPSIIFNANIGATSLSIKCAEMNVAVYCGKNIYGSGADLLTYSLGPRSACRHAINQCINVNGPDVIKSWWRRERLWEIEYIDYDEDDDDDVHAAHDKLFRRVFHQHYHPQFQSATPITLVRTTVHVEKQQLIGITADHNNVHMSIVQAYESSIYVCERRCVLALSIYVIWLVDQVKPFNILKTINRQQH